MYIINKIIYFKYLRYMFLIKYIVWSSLTDKNYFKLTKKILENVDIY